MTDPMRRSHPWCSLGKLPIALLLLSVWACESSTEPIDPDPDPNPVVIEDDFERASLGSSWTVYAGNPGVVSSSDLGVLSNTGGALLGLAILGHTEQTFQADQFSEITLSQDLHPALLMQVFVRRRTSDNQRYGFHWQDSPDRWILKLDGGSPGIELVTLPGTRPQPGDIMRIEVSGSTLRGFLNGQQILQATDSNLPDTGVPGVAMNIFVGNIPDSDFPITAIEVWKGGELGG
jgi:hypothetical protein